jgi:flagellar motor switch protein FliN/FliY
MSEETQNGQEENETLDESQETEAPQEAETSQEESTVDQDSLADEWEKMAEAGEIDTNAAETEEVEAQNDGEESGDVDQQAMIDEWEQMAASAPSEPVEPESYTADGIDVSRLMDIPLEITVEVGSTSMALEELLHLSPNNVIELDKLITEPVDIKVNGRLIAQGELYTVEEQFALKITAIMTPQDRMKLFDEQPW